MSPTPISIFVSRLPGLTRIAITRDSKLIRLLLCRDDEPGQTGSIWLGRVTRVLPEIKAAFLDLGEQNVFLNDLPGSMNRKGGFESAIKEGNLLAVQSKRPAHGDKLAQVSANLKLTGFSGILMPRDPTINFSRNFGGERDPQIYRDMLPHKDYGWIVRSGSDRLSPDVIAREIETLTGQWTQIEGEIESGKPRLLRQGDVLADQLQTWWKEGIRSLYFDDELLYHRYRDMLEQQNPSLLGAMKLHLNETPLFDVYKITSEITAACSNRVRLKSGGWIDIRHTEGMIAIDVNSGKSTAGKSSRTGAMRTNLEAAAEIGRQAGIRNLAGLIMIDFINARSSDHNAKIDKALEAAFRDDPAKTIILPTNRLGIAQISRERTGTDLHTHLEKKCGACRGSGFVERPRAAVIALQEQLLRELPGMRGEQFTIACGNSLAGYLIAKKALLLDSLEKVYEVTLSVEKDNTFKPTHFEIKMGN